MQGGWGGVWKVMMGLGHGAPLSPNSPGALRPGPLQAGRGEPAPRPCPAALRERLVRGPGPAVPASPCPAFQDAGPLCFSEGPVSGWPEFLSWASRWACVTEHRGQWVTGPGSTQDLGLQAQERGLPLQIPRGPARSPGVLRWVPASASCPSCLEG